LQKEKGTHALQKALGYGSKPCKRPASSESNVEGPLAKGKSQPQGVTKSLGKGKKALEKGKKALEKGKKTLEKGKKALEKGKKALEKGKKTLEEGHQGMKDGPWYNVRKTNAKKPKRTYLTGCLQEGQGTRRILIVEVPATWSSQHEYICDEIMKSLQKDKIGKEEALQMRQVLVNNFP
jgi:exonuclease VII small subunit